jgi:hypothetical protein
MAPKFDCLPDNKKKDESESMDGKFIFYSK